jgi:predicted ester cyclase
MSIESNKELSRRWAETFWNERNPEGVVPLMTENPVLHVGGGSFAGLPTLAMVADQWFDPFPDLHCETAQQVGEGERVAEILEFTGHHSGTPYHPGLFRSVGLPPIPTSGKPFCFTQTHIIRIEDSKVAEIWEDFDRVRFWMQLGVTLNVPCASSSS